MSRDVIFLVVGIFLGAILVFSISQHYRFDGVTGATPDYATEKITMPIEGNSYENLGSLTGLRKFSVKYSDKIIRGGEIYDDSAAEILDRMGVKTVVSITPCEKERQFCEKYGYELIEIPFESSDGPKSSDIDLFLETVRKTDGPVYVHCHGGAHRAGALCLAYRLHEENWEQGMALLEYSKLGGDLLGDKGMVERVIHKCEVESDSNKNNEIKVD
jgi:protein tyrosine phosphatase (PTP) superfamily phosphohydrolase (DUF442 family)